MKVETHFNLLISYYYANNAIMNCLAELVKNGEMKLDYYDEIKVLYNGQSLTPYDRFFKDSHVRMFLQPMETKKENNIEKTINKIKEDTRWKLSIQLHKMLKIQ